MSKSNSKKVNKAIMWALMAVTAITMAGCNANNSNGDNTETKNGNSIMSNSDEEKRYDEFTVAYSDTYGAWELNNDIVYHSPSTQTRYTIYADADGGLVGTDGNKYSIKEREYKLYDILNLSDDTLVLKEGVFEQERVGSLDYPDGYKRCVFSYKRCNLFNTDDIESYISTGAISIESGSEEASSEDVTTEDVTDVTTEDVTTEDVTTATVSETTTVETTVIETTTVEQTTNSPANVDTASIEKDITDFMKTDNFVQKDAGNRALELFNHLHNVSDSNVDMNSIENDTANKIVRFNYGDNCVIEVNVEDAVINVK